MIVYVTSFCYPATWAATHHLWRIYLHFGRVHAASVIQGAYHDWSYSPHNYAAQSYVLMQPWWSCWHQGAVTQPKPKQVCQRIHWLCPALSVFSEKPIRHRGLPATHADQVVRRRHVETTPATTCQVAGLVMGPSSGTCRVVWGKEWG